MNLLLTHYKYDDENIPLFNNKTELYNYFLNLEDKVEFENKNFNAENLLSTTQVVDIPNTLSLFKILNYNYCIVDDGHIDEALYFKIKRSKQEQGNRVRLYLEIDAFNTYGYDLLEMNPQALIKRAHLSRFDFNGAHMSGQDAPFNFDKFSPLFEREAIQNVAKRTIDKTRLKFIIDTTSENSTFNNFIHENVMCWKYYFLSSNVTYNFYDMGSNAHSEEMSSMAYSKGGQFVENLNFVVLVAPIYKGSSSKKIYANPQGQYTKRLWSDNEIYNFIIAQQGRFANVKAIKMSFIPPFDIKNIPSTYYEIDANGDMIWKRDDSPLTGFYMSSAINSDCFALRTIQKIDDKILLTSKRFKGIYHSFTDDRLTKEPKLYNEDYSTYKLFIGGQQFELPVSKTSFEPKFYYHEMLSPEITKGMICFATSKELTYQPITNNVFPEDTESDFTGFSFSVDLGLWIPQLVIDSFLANNKNYFQINANNATARGFNAILGTIGSIFNASQSIEPNMIGAYVNAGLGLMSTGISMMTDATNRELTLDNMRNAPETVSNLNSNPLLLSSIGQELGIFIELQMPLIHEQSAIVDYFDKYGYAYNRLGIVNNFIKTRKLFNYIEADINDIHIKASEDVKTMLKNMFLKGIRFWHNKNSEIEYNLNNYELEWEDNNG